MVKRTLIGLIAVLFTAFPAMAQLPPAAGITIDKTPVQGGTTTQCLYITSTRKVGSQACGGTATNITVGTTTVTGGTASGIVWNNAGVLAAGPTITDATGNLTLPTNAVVTLPTTGSALLPSLTSSVDTTSGVYFRAAGTVAITTSGSARWEFATNLLRGTNNGVVGFSSNLPSNSLDTGISRVSAGVLGVGTGTTGSVAGTLQALNVTLGSGGVLQLGNAYAVGVVAMTGTVTLKDSSGTTVRVLVANP